MQIGLGRLKEMKTTPVTDPTKQGTDSRKGAVSADAPEGRAANADRFDPDLGATRDTRHVDSVVFVLDAEDRIRSVVEGPTGALWVLEDEDGEGTGRLLKLTPKS